MNSKFHKLHNVQFGSIYDLNEALNDYIKEISIISSDSFDIT